MRGHSPTLLLILGISLFLAACGSGDARPGIPYDPGTRPELPGAGDTPTNPPPGDGGSGEPTFPQLTGGVLVKVDTRGETWLWWVTNPATATLLERAWNGTYTGSFHGRLRRGPGEAGHNAPWSWHVDSEANGGDLVFIQPPAPGSSPHTPSECESQLEQWLSKDTLFVPYWPVRILTFDDRRP